MRCVHLLSVEYEMCTTDCNDYQKGGHRNVSILSKVNVLQCSYNVHAWKVIPLFFIKNYPGRNFLFHLNLSIRCKTVKKNFKKFWKNREVLRSCPNGFSPVASDVIWYNKYLEINNNIIYDRFFSKESITHIRELFESNGTMKSLEDFTA